MATIQAFDVIQPPTSRDVRERAFESLRRSDVMRLVLLPHQEVPPPAEISIPFRVLQVANLEDDGSMTILGHDENTHNSVRVTTEANLSLPASGTMVLS